MADIPTPHTPTHETAADTVVNPAHLVQAVELATANAATGQMPFGALVLIGNDVVATGVNTALRDLDPLAHAEVAAVRNACRYTGSLVLRDATVVSSCEPCAMCHAVAAAVGVHRIVYAATKESVGDLGGPGDPQHLAVLSQMRDALRAAAPGQVVHVPIAGAEVPFDRYRAGAGR